MRAMISSFSGRLRERFPRLVKSAQNQRLRKAIRVGRGLAIVYGVGVGAYAYGQIAVAKDPKGYEKKILLQTLHASGATAFACVNSHDSLKARTIFQKLQGERAPRQPIVTGIAQDNMGQRVVAPEHPVWLSATHCARVFSKVQAAAHHVAAARVSHLRQKKGLPDRHGFQHVDDTIPWETLGIDPFYDDLEEWEHVERMLAAKWKIVVTDQLSPNAFVSPLLPRRVFTNIGLLELFCKNDDQLAAILGHELSHAMLAHSEQRLELEMVQQALTLVLVSMLDFTGVFTFLFEAGLFATNVGQWLPSHFSREHEREADTLGAYLAARACYDPAAMKVAFENMLDVEQCMTGGHVHADMLSTHPATTERVENASVRADHYLKQMYDACKRDGGCPAREQWDGVLDPKHSKVLWERMQKQKSEASA